MEIKKTLTEGALVLAPLGRLDSMTAGDLETAVEETVNEEVEKLTFDLEEVDFVSSKGLRVLVSAYRKMNGKPVALEHVNPSVMEVLKLSGLLKVFTVNG